MENLVNEFTGQFIAFCFSAGVAFSDGRACEVEGALVLERCTRADFVDTSVPLDCWYGGVDSEDEYEAPKVYLDDLVFAWDGVVLVEVVETVEGME